MTKDDWNGTFSSNSNVGSLQGYFFVVNLIMLIRKRAKPGKDYRCGVEVQAAFAFDDIVIKWGDKCRIFQAKHKLDPRKEESVIDQNSLLTRKNEDFSLQKYFINFCEIIQSDLFKNENIEEIIIITNIDFAPNFLTKPKKGEFWGEFFIQISISEMNEFQKTILFTNSMKIYKINKKFYNKVEKKIKNILINKRCDIENKIKKRVSENIKQVGITFERMEELFVQIFDRMQKKYKKKEQLDNLPKIEISDIQHFNNIENENDKCVITIIINKILEKDWKNNKEAYLERLKTVNSLDSEFEENIKLFMSKLTFITNYPSVGDLNKLVKDEYPDKHRYLIHKDYILYYYKHLYDTVDYNRSIFLRF